jgi:hypothetical protein
MESKAIGVMVLALGVSRAALGAGPGIPLQNTSWLEEKEGSGSGSSSSVGWFAGPMFSYLMIDFSPLDRMTEDRGIDPLENNGMLYGGMAGITYNNLRLGAFFFWGPFVESYGDVGTDSRAAELTMWGGGLLGEYNRPLATNLGISLGLMAGEGKIEISALGHDFPGGDSSPHGLGIYYFAYPYLGAWVEPVAAFRAELDVGYMAFVFDPKEGNYWGDLDKDFFNGALKGGLMINLKFLLQSPPK